MATFVNMRDLVHGTNQSFVSEEAMQNGKWITLGDAVPGHTEVREAKPGADWASGDVLVHISNALSYNLDRQDETDFVLEPGVIGRAYQPMNGMKLDYTADGFEGNVSLNSYVVPSSPEVDKDLTVVGAKPTEAGRVYGKVIDILDNFIVGTMYVVQFTRVTGVAE